MANITFLDSEATYPGRDDVVPFVGQSDAVGNLALTYEKGKFFGRIALNWRSERLREDETIGGDVYEDIYVDDFNQIDLTFRYRATKNWTVYTELINITDEPFHVFLKSPSGSQTVLVRSKNTDGVRMSVSAGTIDTNFHHTVRYTAADLP